VRAEAVDGEQAQREQDALAQVWHLKHVADGGEELFHDV
jgi:hypothetical protein